MAKVIQFNSEGGIQPSSVSVSFGTMTRLGVVNNDANGGVHSVVWDVGSPDVLLNDPANGQDIAPGNGVFFAMSEVPKGTFTFRDGHNMQSMGQLIVV